MPCDTITTTGIELGKNIEPGLLFAALESLNLHPQNTATGITWYGGSWDSNTKQASMRSSSMAGQDATEQTAAIKVAYGHQVAQSYAKKYGWTLKKTGENKYAVVKRY